MPARADGPSKTTAVQKRGRPESQRYLRASKPAAHPLPSPGQVLVTNSTSGHSGTQRGIPESSSPDTPEPLEEQDTGHGLEALAGPPGPFTVCFFFFFPPRSEVLEEQGDDPSRVPRAQQPSSQDRNLLLSLEHTSESSASLSLHFALRLRADFNPPTALLASQNNGKENN